MNNEDLQWLEAAYETAAVRSADPRTNVGAVLVMPHKEEFFVAYGASNELLPGCVPRPERFEAPGKYAWLAHAETTAIMHALVNTSGKDVASATLYAPWAACSKCAAIIILAGVRRLVRHKKIMDATPARWQDDIAIAETMMREAGVQIDDLEADFPDCRPIMFNGKLWQP